MLRELGLRRSARCCWLPLACLFLYSGGRHQACFALGPDSPEVQALVSKALTFLDNSVEEPRLGAKSIVALALTKGDRPRNHPKIRAAVDACQAAVANLERSHIDSSVYDLGVSIIFLCELDPEQYRPEIKALTELLIKWQKPFGAWGYLEGPNITNGDTSMTQYGVLAMWTADRVGAYPLKVAAATNAANWLIRTQDPSGGWGYQGVDPKDYRRVPQTPVQPSLSAAGCGSLYVLGDLLRLTGDLRGAGGLDSGLPPALRLAKATSQPRPSKGPMTDKVDRSRLREAMSGGDQWFEKNFTVSPEEWIYYYLYALERYKSFRELTYGREEKNPSWYNAGVDYLTKSQRPDGSWVHDAGAPVDTAFGILFLVRGTRKTIQKAEAYNGLLRGGRGLPGNSDVTVNARGQIVKTPFQGEAESLLSILEAASADDIEALGEDLRVELSDDPEQRGRQVERLRRLVRADDYATRMAALQALHAMRDLDNVPTFIFALSDPDPRIVGKANDALRLMSRKLDGFNLGDDPTEGEKLDAINRWKDWYRSLRPDAQFIN